MALPELTETLSSKFFENTQVAFRNKSDKDLKRIYWLFRIISNNFLTRTGPMLANFSFKIGLPIKGIIRDTIFNQFCGGESIDECDKVIEELYSYGVGTILDYSVEGDSSEAGYDATRDEILLTIHKAKNNPAIPFSVFKPSGLGSFALFEKVGRKERLSKVETNQFEKIVDRIDSICHDAGNNDVRLLIDAEHSWIQRVIDDIVAANMEKYNKEKSIIFNTYQLYRKDTLDALKEDIEFAANKGFFIGAKLVRGAYMELERKRARENNYPSPVHENKEDTDRAYNDAVLLCLDHMDNTAFMAGTHNEQSTLLLVNEMAERKIACNDPNIFFAQLYGMSDHISFNLAHNGFNVAKYLPYGSVGKVMPYLFRRAKENTSVGGQAGREMTLLLNEMRRRGLK